MRAGRGWRRLSVFPPRRAAWWVKYLKTNSYILNLLTQVPVAPGSGNTVFGLSLLQLALVVGAGLAGMALLMLPVLLLARRRRAGRAKAGPGQEAGQPEPHRSVMRRYSVRNTLYHATSPLNSDTTSPPTT